MIVHIVSIPVTIWTMQIDIVEQDMPISAPSIAYEEVSDSEDVTLCTCPEEWKLLGTTF